MAPTGRKAVLAARITALVTERQKETVGDQSTTALTKRLNGLDTDIKNLREEFERSNTVKGLKQGMKVWVWLNDAAETEPVEKEFIGAAYQPANTITVWDERKTVTRNVKDWQIKGPGGKAQSKKDGKAQSKKRKRGPESQPEVAAQPEPLPEPQPEPASIGTRLSRSLGLSR